MERVGQRPDPPPEPVARREATAAPAEAPCLDLRGEVCPYTFLKAKLALEALAPGAELRVLVDNAESARDVPRSVSGAGHAVLGVEALPAGVWAIAVRRGAAVPSSRGG